VFRKQSTLKDYYYILGLSRTATGEQIKLAYHKLAIKFHPDKNNGDKFFEERFKDIQEAYDALSDSNKRRNYDNNFKRNATGNSQSSSSFEENLKKEFEQELYKRKREHTDELNRKEREHNEELRRKEKEHLEQLERAKEETKRKYQTPEQKSWEEAENKRKLEELNRVQEQNKFLKELETNKTKLNQKKEELQNLNYEIVKKQVEINQIKNEIESLNAKLSPNDGKRNINFAATINFKELFTLILLVCVALAYIYFFHLKSPVVLVDSQKTNNVDTSIQDMNVVNTNKQISKQSVIKDTLTRIDNNNTSKNSQKIEKYLTLANVRVYFDSSEHSYMVAIINQHTLVRILNKENPNWYKIKFNDIEGYIESNHLKFASEAVLSN